MAGQEPRPCPACGEHARARRLYYNQFMPTDDSNTILYVRYCQKVVRAPVARSLFNLAGVAGSIVIARQDKRVVVTQRPIKSEARMGERVIQGDRPILLYRRHRQALIDAAAAG